VCQKKFSICSRDNFIESNLQQVRRFSRFFSALRKQKNQFVRRLCLTYIIIHRRNRYVTFRLERNEAFSKTTENRKSIKNGLHLLPASTQWVLMFVWREGKNCKQSNCFFNRTISIEIFNCFCTTLRFALCVLEFRASLFDNGWLRLIPFFSLINHSFNFSSINHHRSLILTTSLLKRSREHNKTWSRLLRFLTIIIHLYIIISCVQCRSGKRKGESGSFNTMWFNFNLSIQQIVTEHENLHLIFELNI
jgi:hypothetical protein